LQKTRGIYTKGDKKSNRESEKGKWEKPRDDQEFIQRKIKKKKRKTGKRWTPRDLCRNKNGPRNKNPLGTGRPVGEGRTGKKKLIPSKKTFNTTGKTSGNRKARWLENLPGKRPGGVEELNNGFQQQGA